ncbi:MAG: hypothetical protein FH758_06055 [Firmicutes bacterium]|nr:hypothetical protein [Bacillota bacterium]
MSRQKILFLFILIHIPLAAGIYAGTFLLPDYMEARQEHLKQTNYFLTDNNNLIKNNRELIIAQKCNAFLEDLQNEYKSKLEALGKDAYLEYKEQKVADPNFSVYNLAGKYLNKLSRLDNHCRTKLNNYLNTMDRELKANNLSTKLIEQAKFAYRIKKGQIKNNFYNKAKEMAANKGIK